MIALWILVGFIALAFVPVAVMSLYKAIRYIVLFALMLFGRIFIERKMTVKLLAWGMKRNEDRTFLAFGIVGWVVVILTLAAIAAVPIVIYSLLV